MLVGVFEADAEHAMGLRAPYVTLSTDKAFPNSSKGVKPAQLGPVEMEITLSLPRLISDGGSASTTAAAGGTLVAQSHQSIAVYVANDMPFRETTRTGSDKPLHSTPCANDKDAERTESPSGVSSVQVNPMDEVVSCQHTRKSS